MSQKQTKANFMSDNAAGATPKVMAALQDANVGKAPAYGNDTWTERATGAIRDVLEAPNAEVLLTATGTAANALALATITPPYGAIYCHPQAHINSDECGAPEFYTSGAKLVLVEGEHGKIKPEDLNALLEEGGRGVHHVKPATVSLSQSTEAGTVYSVDEVRAIADVAHAHGLKLHMDGARFANALIATGASPCELSWKAGVDILSFGLSKNGGLSAEAVVQFNPVPMEAGKAKGGAKGDVTDLEFRRKRAGHLVSKMRFIAAQWIGALDGGDWLKTASHANARAAELADGLTSLKAAELMHPVEANEVFVRLASSIADQLEADGFGFYRWQNTPAGVTLRLVTAFDTTEDETAEFLDAVRRHLG